MAAIVTGTPPPPRLEPADFDERLAWLKNFNDNSLHLIEDILGYYKHREASFIAQEERLRTELRNSQLDLTSATQTRRKLQEELEARDAIIEKLKKKNDFLENTDPYMAVLIDGDGLLFQKEYVQQGLEGGKKAAAALREAVVSVANKTLGSRWNNIDVVATVYANLSGLTHAMRRAGWLEGHADVLREFTCGFTQSKASFHFIDVGYGKERADAKIRGATNWHLSNPHCKMVALGVSHDAGYAPFIDDIASASEVRDRIVLLEATPATQELQATNIKIHNLANAVFYNDKLADRPVTANTTTTTTNTTTTTTLITSNTINSSTAASSAAPVKQQTSSANGLRDAENGGLGRRASTSSGSPSTGSAVVPPTTSYASTTKAGSPPTTSYASTTKAGSPPPKIVLPAQTVKQMKKKTAAAAAAKKQPEKWNPGPRGLDPPIKYSVSVIEQLRARPTRVCNRHVLQGNCPKGSYCLYAHPTKSTAEEIAALAYMSRLSPCSAGQNCVDEDCIFGHNCPSVYNGYCAHPYCKFSENEHPPNTKFKGA